MSNLLVFYLSLIDFFSISLQPWVFGISIQAVDCKILTAILEFLILKLSVHTLIFTDIDLM